MSFDKLKELFGNKKQPATTIGDLKAARARLVALRTRALIGVDDLNDAIYSIDEILEQK